MTRYGGESPKVWESVGWEGVQGLRKAQCKPPMNWEDAAVWSQIYVWPPRPPQILEVSEALLNDLCSCLKTTTASTMVIKESNHMGATLNNAMS